MKPVFAFLLHKDTGFLHRLARACGGSTYDLVVVSISMGVTSRLLYSVPLPTLLLIACVALLTVFKIYEMRQRDIRRGREHSCACVVAPCVSHGIKPIVRDTCGMWRGDVASTCP